jgi:glycosyltransferase involved in cell wall biosynthesis
MEQVYADLFTADRFLQSPIRIISPRAHEVIYNHLFVLETLYPFLEQNEIHWSLPNWGSEVEIFKDAASDLLGKSVFLYPRRVRGDLMRSFAEHDIYLSASDSDSSPASLIEAMGLGLVPVCADIPGIREWLTRDNGFLFGPEDGDELYAIMQKLISRSETYTSMLNQNRDLVMTKGIFETNVAQMISIMREAVIHSKEKQ